MLMIVNMCREHRHKQHELQANHVLSKEFEVCQVHEQEQLFHKHSNCHARPDRETTLPKEIKLKSREMTVQEYLKYQQHETSREQVRPRTAKINRIQERKNDEICDSYLSFGVIINKTS